MIHLPIRPVNLSLWDFNNLISPKKKSDYFNKIARKNIALVFGFDPIKLYRIWFKLN